MVIVTIVIKPDGHCSVLSLTAKTKRSAQVYTTAFGIGDRSYIQFPIAMSFDEAKAMFGSDTRKSGGLVADVPVLPEVVLLILKTLEGSPLFNIKQSAAHRIRHKLGEQHVHFQNFTREDDDDRHG